MITIGRLEVWIVGTTVRFKALHQGEAFTLYEEFNGSVFVKLGRKGSGGAAWSMTDWMRDERASHGFAADEKVHRVRLMEEPNVQK